MRRRKGFTLVELLVVVSIIALLIAILLPSLSEARKQAKTAKCMSNMRSMELAHWTYMVDYDGSMIQAGMAHGGAHKRDEVAWFNTLKDNYNNQLVLQCPSDLSPHWKGGEPVALIPDIEEPNGVYEQYRLSSYGINEFTDRELVPWGGPYVKLNMIRKPVSTIHFLEMAEEGEYAGADHPHVDLWVGNVLYKASRHLQIDQHGGKPMTWGARANYGFLDGHVETLPFEKVFKNREINKLDPAVAN